MISFAEELTLKMYFSIIGFLGQSSYDKKQVFDCLSKIYAIANDKGKKLFSFTEDKAVSDIKTEKDFNRFLRIKQYLELQGTNNKADSCIDDIISIKGNALMEMTKHGVSVTAQITQTDTISLLIDQVGRGSILAMNVVGILQLEGIIFEKDNFVGLKNICKAASWGSIEALYAALYYDKKNTQIYLRQLCNKLNELSHIEAVKALVKSYGEIPSGKGKEEIILNKAFDWDVIKRDVYSEKHARILFSKAISWKDKEEILRSDSKEAMAELSKLPLGLISLKPIAYSEEAIKSLPFKREEEQNFLLRCLSNSDLRGKSYYRPLCLCSESDYLLDIYVTAIKDSMKDVNFERFEVSELGDHDFDPTMNNIFVRSCVEDVPNIFLFSFKGNDINSKAYGFAKDFIKNSKRAKFRLNKPSVCMDLSSILIICIADKENAKHLHECCDVRYLASVSTKEKTTLLDKIIKDKAQLYGISNISYDEYILERITDVSIDKMEKLIDRVILENRVVGGSLILNEDLLKASFNDLAKDKEMFGFGGVINESY